jgi:exoribonuclease R
MNMDGTLKDNTGIGESIFYGRSVIKSYARLDNATAQNIIDNKVAIGEAHADESFCSKRRQPTGGHTIDEVADDVRLMHKVAMARRKLRFENGALALNGIKLAFKLDEDGETPQLCAPYPIRDSNRLIEEYMLLANYLVAQRLITHAHGRALLRNHDAPIQKGMQQVVEVSKESYNFDIDTTNSKTLQESLSRLSRECDDELVVQCITESLVTPMRPAEYIAAGELAEEEWQHFALNIPYYTHFTSPIRRYPDVIVHRLLQATLDDTVENFPSAQKEIHEMADHCNDMRMNARKAQDRSDRVFLSLYLKKNPISSVLGVCLSVGEKTFTVFVPSLGISTRVFLQEHEDEFTINAYKDSNDKRRIVIQPKTDVIPGMDPTAVAAVDEKGSSSIERGWKSLDIRVFTKLEVACSCKNQAPIDVRVKVVGPWAD